MVGRHIIVDCRNLADEAGQEHGYNFHISMTTCVCKYINVTTREAPIGEM